MKYCKKTITPPKPEKLTARECTPGEIYEFVPTCTLSETKPNVRSLRLCTVKHDLISLHDGIWKGGVPPDAQATNAVYVHRPDVQLTIVED